VQHLAEALEHLNEAPVLALGEIGVDDVVVQEVRSGAGCYGEQLVAGAMDQNGAERTDFGGDVNWHP